jgi:hypothetical protein
MEEPRRSSAILAAVEDAIAPVPVDTPVVLDRSGAIFHRPVAAGAGLYAQLQAGLESVPGSLDKPAPRR